MKSSLRVLTWGTLACGSLLAAYLLVEPWLARRHARVATSQGETPAATSPLARVEAANIKVDESGDQQLLSAIARLEQQGSVIARIRQQSHIGDLTFYGIGTYRQQGRGTRRHFRWLLQSQRDGVQSTLLQISDGRFLWTDRDLGASRHIDRVDLWQLRRQIKNNSGEPTFLASGSLSDSSPIAPQLGVSFGGLPMLLDSLRKHFEFTAPRPFQFGEQAVLGIVGRWRPEALAAILVDPPADNEDAPTAADLRLQLQKYLSDHNLPDRMPHHVLMVLGHRDLFPYLIDYRGSDDPLSRAGLPVSDLFQLSEKPLARLEFFEVRFDQTIDTREFLYTPPPEPQWFDRTDNYLARLDRLKRVQLALDGQQRIATGEGGRAR